MSAETADQESFFLSGVIFLMLDLYTVLHINLDLQKNNVAKDVGKLIRKLKCLSVDTGGFNN